MKKHVMKILVLFLAVSGSIMISTNVAQARPTATTRVTVLENSRIVMKATCNEKCDQIVLSYQVSYTRNGRTDVKSIKDAANNTTFVYAGWSDPSVKITGYWSPVTVVLIHGQTLLL